MICETSACLTRAGTSGYCNRCAQHALLALRSTAILEDAPLPDIPDIQPIRRPQCLACPSSRALPEC